MPVIIFLLLFSVAKKSFSQDSLATQDFKKGVPASSFNATAGDQSATLNWASAVFPSSGTMKAGYLLIYSTSTPSLVSSPDGLTPDFAVLNGTIVTTDETYLPAQPTTAATANGLRNGATYNFQVVAYIWDGKNVSSYQYSAGTTICLTIPPDGPDNLVLPADGVSANFISGSFTAPLFTPSGYLVVYSTSAVEPTITNGHLYQQGETFGMDTVAQVSSSISFSTSNSGYNLAPSTTYYIYVFSYSLSACNGQPVYSSGYLTDSIATSATAPQALMMLDYFTAAKSNGFNKLTWKAASSSSLLTFQAQRSFDSLNFTDIYTVSMSSILQCGQPFTYNDYTITDAELYYRIKATDQAGHVAYSNIAGVGEMKNKFEIFGLAQNPVQGDAMLNASSSQNDKLELMIFSIDGRLVQHQTVQVQTGANTIILPTTNFVKGMYIIRGIFGTGESKLISFIK